MFAALIVDDHDDDLASSADLRSALVDAGCDQIDVASSEEAIAILQSGSRVPDVVVLKLVGADVERLQRLRAAQDLPFVVLCEDRHVDEAILAGATECVTIPVRPRELHRRIRATLHDRRDARDRAQRERRRSDAIATLQREKEDLERMACVDALTGVASRRYALSLLEAERGRSAREHLPLGLVMIDLDCYHAYNEQYGHLGGDRCLQRVCEVMVKCLRRPSDLLGRYGGEEFIAVLPSTDAVGSKIVAERLRASVEALKIPHLGSTCARVVTITAGFVSLRATTDMTIGSVISVADAALLRAKARGRNQVDGEAPRARTSRRSSRLWQRFDPVFADPWLAERIPTFLNKAHAGARGLRMDQPASVADTAASLALGARDLGLSMLEGLLADLERAAIASDPTAAGAAVDELIQYITHVQVVYRRGGDAAGPATATTSQ